MRIGIFGGTFDPIHMAHLMLAETAREVGQLDEVWFIPAFSPPQKETVTVSLPKHRLEMVRLAIAGNVHFRVSKVEIERKGVSFTIDTLRTVREAHPQDELFLVIGGDSLQNFLTWKEPAGILDLATVIAVNRGKTPLDPQPILDALGQQYRDRFVLCSMPGTEISASDLRQRTREGRTIRYLTPRSVELYLQQHKLYPAAVDA